MIVVEKDAYPVVIYHDHENRVPERTFNGAAGVGGTGGTAPNVSASHHAPATQHAAGPNATALSRAALCKVLRRGHRCAASSPIEMSGRDHVRAKRSTADPLSMCPSGPMTSQMAATVGRPAAAQSASDASV
jgi:hypothetical protein